MRKLETYVNEKLKVTKRSDVPDLISFLEFKNKEEFNLLLRNLLEYLKDDSNLPIAEVEYLKNGFSRLSRKYENTHDTFLKVSYPDGFLYGTWDDTYGLTYSTIKNGIKNYTSSVIKGFKKLVFDNAMISESEEVYIITKNKELMEQINYLMQKVEPPE